MTKPVALGKRDYQSVTFEGQRVAKLIEGVAVRYAVVHPDERGEVCEIYSSAWGFSSAPLVYVYSASVRPGKIKGWVYHERQDDRLFVLSGALQIVLFDLRQDSPTSSLINEICLTERNRGLISIPSMVAHAVQNIGTEEAFFINMPTRPYDHANPDKFRVPKEKIPYMFHTEGW